MLGQEFKGEKFHIAFFIMQDFVHDLCNSAHYLKPCFIRGMISFQTERNKKINKIIQWNSSKMFVLKWMLKIPFCSSKTVIRYTNY